MRIQDLISEAYGRSGWDSNMPDWQRREQDSWDASKRAFKYAELQHELGDEEDEQPYKSRNRFSSSRRPSAASRGMYFYNVPSGKEGEAQAYGLKQTKSGKWFSSFPNLGAEKLFGPGKFWQAKNESVDKKALLASKISQLQEQITSMKESATAGATMSGNIASIPNPHLSPGKARGKKSFTGSPGKSGTKAPPQPKPKDNTGVNGLDVKSVSIFGGPAARR